MATIRKPKKGDIVSINGARVIGSPRTKAAKKAATKPKPWLNLDTFSGQWLKYMRSI